ncbi:MAG: OmpA family protein, partial [Desulfovibrionaceae bacterium]|nr:OmpA family protein [Desulfovibrionaceae bacterium]
DAREAMLAAARDLKSRLAVLNAPPGAVRGETNALLASLLQKLDAPKDGSAPKDEPDPKTEAGPDALAAQAGETAPPPGVAAASPQPVRRSVAFAAGMVEPGPDETQGLREFAARLRDGRARAILVLGYADDSPPRRELRKRYGDNVAVSKARADSVAAALTGAGIDGASVLSHGLGPQPPDGAAPEDRARLRRVDIIAF